MSGLNKAKSAAVYAKYSVDAIQHAATKRRTRFVLYTLGRTGSTLLEELLNSHSAIQCDGEILHDEVASARLTVAGSAMKATKPIYGFKVLTTQLVGVQHVEPRDFLDWLDHRGYRIIHVQRRNTLQHALSIIKARMHGFHHRGAVPETARQAVHIDVDELGQWLNGITKLTTDNEQLLTRYPNVLTYVYEDDLASAADQHRTVQAVCDALDVPMEPVSTDLVRATPDRLQDLIENYDEVAAYLAGTAWEKFLTT